MKIKDICVSLELAKELKEAGYPQESLFFYSKTKYNGKTWNWELKASADSNFRQFVTITEPTKIVGKDNTAISAPTVAELGEALLKLKVLDGICFLHPKEKWSFIYINSEGDDVEVFADTEANARAKMWLYLKKEGLLTNN